MHNNLDTAHSMQISMYYISCQPLVLVTVPTMTITRMPFISVFIINYHNNFNILNLRKILT